VPKPNIVYVSLGILKLRAVRCSSISTSTTSQHYDILTVIIKLLQQHYYC